MVHLDDAVVAGNVDGVRAALDAGADPNKIDRGRERHHVCLLAANYGCAKILQLLLEHGADTDVTARNGETLLHLVVVNGWRRSDENLAPLVAILAAAGLDVDAPHPNGQVPLEISARYGCRRCCAELLRAGAALPRGLTRKAPFSRAGGTYPPGALEFLKVVERVGSWGAYAGNGVVRFLDERRERPPISVGDTPFAQADMAAFHRDPQRVLATLAEAIKRVPMPALRLVVEFSGPVVEG